MNFLSPLHRDVFGETAILGDRRWAGAYGIDADFIAGDHCAIAQIHTRHIQVFDVQAELNYCVCGINVGVESLNLNEFEVI